MTVSDTPKNESVNSLCMYIMVLKILSTVVVTIKFVKEAVYEWLVEDFSFKPFTHNCGEILWWVFVKVQLSTQSARLKKSLYHHCTLLILSEDTETESTGVTVA